MYEELSPPKGREEKEKNKDRCDLDVSGGGLVRGRVLEGKKTKKNRSK